MAFAPDNRRVIACLGDTRDTRVWIWDVENGRELRQLPILNQPSITSLAVSSDGRRALLGCLNAGLRLLDLETGQELRPLPIEVRSVTAVALSPGGRHALTGRGTTRIEGDRKIVENVALQLWDVASGQELHRFEGLTDALTSVVISADGRLALAGSGDGLVRLWDLSRRIPVQR